MERLTKKGTKHLRAWILSITDRLRYDSGKYETISQEEYYRRLRSKRLEVSMILRNDKEKYHG